MQGSRALSEIVVTWINSLLIKSVQVKNLNVKNLRVVIQRAIIGTWLELQQRSYTGSLYAPKFEWLFPSEFC